MREGINRGGCMAVIRWFCCMCAEWFPKDTGDTCPKCGFPMVGEYKEEYLAGMEYEDK